MTSLEFATKLNSINEKSEVLEAIYAFINNCSGEYSKDEIRFFIDNISEEKFTSFGNKLGFCRNHCIEELKKSDNETEPDYLQRLRKVEKLLFELSTIYQNIVTNRKEAKETSGVEDAIHQNAAVLKEVNAKVTQFRKDLKNAKKDIEKANNLIDESTKNIDNKIFSLLINTVAILGIFVAIAFAGFGITSIFSNIGCVQMLSSREDLIKSVFFLHLAAVLSYNLLLLLVYFIYKLSRPLIIKITKDNNGSDLQETFTKTINLTPFIWIDVIMAVLAIGLLIVCLILG